MLKVLNKRLVQLGQGASPYYAELICDDFDELPSADHYGDWIIDMGSIAHVINTGDTYRLNSDGDWKLQKKVSEEGGGGGNVDSSDIATTDEVDKMLEKVFGS